VHDKWEPALLVKVKYLSWPRARRTLFLGFKRGVKCYKLWDSEDWKIVLSRDVTFDEYSMMKTLSSQEVEIK